MARRLPIRMTEGYTAMNISNVMMQPPTVVPPNHNTLPPVGVPPGPPTSSNGQDYIGDVTSVSQKFNALADKLAQLKSADPAKFAQVQSEIVQKLSTAAQSAGSGFKGNLLNALSSAVQGNTASAPTINVSQTGAGAQQIQSTVNETLSNLFTAVDQSVTAN